MQSLLENMKLNHIYGNEFVQTLLLIGKTKYFGDKKLEQSYLGKLQNEKNERKRYKRYIILRQQKNEKDDNNFRKIYMIDTDTLDLEIYSQEDIIKMLNSGELIYECEKHKITGIDKEVEDDEIR